MVLRKEEGKKRGTRSPGVVLSDEVGGEGMEAGALNHI